MRGEVCGVSVERFSSLPDDSVLLQNNGKGATEVTPFLLLIAYFYLTTDWKSGDVSRFSNWLSEEE
jgi:hypothetical protein